MQKWYFQTKSANKFENCQVAFQLCYPIFSVVELNQENINQAELNQENQRRSGHVAMKLNDIRSLTDYLQSYDLVFTCSFVI